MISGEAETDSGISGGKEHDKPCVSGDLSPRDDDAGAHEAQRSKLADIRFRLQDGALDEDSVFGRKCRIDAKHFIR